MRRNLPLLLLLLCGAAFAAGVWHLLRLRFEAGDVYPAYSSLRADPLGTMALYESLQRMPGRSVERDYSALGRLPDGKGCVYLHLAARRYQWQHIPEDVLKEAEGFVTRGGRLVIAFLPMAREPRFFETDELADRERKTDGKKPSSKEPRKDGRKTPKGKPRKAPTKQSPDADEEEGVQRVELQDRWHFELGLIPLNTPEGESPQPARVINRSELPLPQTLQWHSGLILTNLGSDWKSIYTRGRHPVLVERRMGSGSIVLATDCFFLSNEALRADRQTPLLLWTLGERSHVVFDEAHLGTTESAGVAALVKRYRLVWVVLVIGLLGILFLWKNAASFVPAPEEQDADETVSGKEAASGFINLLRRNIVPAALLKVCFAEWEKSASRKNNSHLAARVAEAQGVLKAEETLTGRARNPVAAYQQIARILYPPKRPPPTNKP